MASTVKLVKSINPKSLFRSMSLPKKKSRSSLSRSDPSSFTSSSSSTHLKDVTGPGTPMKNISPKSLFRSMSLPKKKSRSSLSRSDPSSFTSSSSSESSSSSTHLKDVTGPGTPTSVLPSCPQQVVSGKWSDLSADMTFELVQSFKLIDKDGDGKITRHELEEMLTRLGLEPESEEELAMMLMDVDRDGDGCVSLEEFGALSSAFGPACGSELRDAFDFFDANRDGKISAEELLKGFLAIGDDRCTLEDCKRMIDGVDTDGDGFVCFEDFSRMMERQR
ncbi:probable calcium-binding protein CML36 [Macadamia integrifolia]|uniref:probable calcium-binding protein CML36 n=1 Tax=Macadamia integrifolia TaxID=60698 RepID=UPI001C4FC885|nr:probable calcium-binding protein CML36 [Macadamia integrifolia]